MAMALRKLLDVPALGFRQHVQIVSLPDLPCDFGAVEPAITGEVVKLHYQKYHQAYITIYQEALEQLDDAVNKGDALISSNCTTQSILWAEENEQLKAQVKFLSECSRDTDSGFGEASNGFHIQDELADHDQTDKDLNNFRLATTADFKILQCLLWLICHRGNALNV